MNDKEKLEAIKKIVDEIWRDNYASGHYDHLHPMPKLVQLIKETLEK